MLGIRELDRDFKKQLHLIPFTRSVRRRIRIADADMCLTSAASRNQQRPGIFRATRTVVGPIVDEFRDRDTLTSTQFEPSMHRLQKNFQRYPCTGLQNSRVNGSTKSSPTSDPSSRPVRLALAGNEEH
nr:hypothetical protein CFP56_71061 [Quercus suber]